MNDIITNGTEIKQRIISEINSSKQFIYLAMAFFTDRDIANSIIVAKNRNVNVDIILSSNAQNETVKKMFTEAGIKVHAFETGDERGMMHHKFCLIDNKFTINGSYNYSYNASNNNVENIHISDDFTIYKQFLIEFERLKYNIDNNIELNSLAPMNNNTQLSQNTNSSDSFSQQLHNLVYLSTQLNTEDFKKKGFEKSKECFGSTDIFKAEFNNIKEQIRIHATDDSLSSKKSILIANITNAFENKQTEIERDKENEIKYKKNDFELNNRQFADKILQIQQEKSVLESGNQNTGEKGIFQINREIDKNKLEIKSLDQSVIVKKFVSFGTISVSIFLTICLFYLCIFFASALYKVFFEGNIIRASLEAGINPGIPQIIDANAIFKIFSLQGWIFGMISALIFLFPLSLTNLKIIGSKNNVVNIISFWIGLVIFDILVSGMVAINTNKIESLLIGQQSNMQFWEVVKQGEFYLIFIFGMLPLFITHFLIDYLTNAYNKSKIDVVNADVSKKIKIVESDLIDLNSDKEIITKKINILDESLNQMRDKILNLETELNNIHNQTYKKYDDQIKNIKLIYDDYITKIKSGKIFTDVILKTITSAYATGFIEYLPLFYADSEVGNRIRDIEQIIKTNQ